MHKSSPLLVLLLVLLMLPASVRADDSAAAIGAGGLVVLKNEKRVAMAKEVLTIGLHKVHVEYEFRNDTPDNVTTLVAFPIPAYHWGEGINEQLPAMGFEDFKLTIEGQPATFQIEAIAKLDGKDVSAVLQAAGIDIMSLGHFDAKTDTVMDLKKLSTAQVAALVKAGLIETNAGEPKAGTPDNPIMTHPNWSVEKKYYWTQTFPAHSTVHIAHDYTPVPGYMLMSREALHAFGPQATAAQKSVYGPESELTVLAAVCVDESLRAELETAANKSVNQGYLRYEYVDFILTTANTWKQPITDFTMLVERPTAKDDPKLVSFCWDGPVTKTGPNEFKATATNLVPTKEVRIGLFATAPPSGN